MAAGDGVMKSAKDVNSGVIPRWAKRTSVVLLLLTTTFLLLGSSALGQTTPQCSPVPCSEILVQAPYELDFSQDHGQILDANGVGTGFTYIAKRSSGTSYRPDLLTVDTTAPGTLQVQALKGKMDTTSNSQHNALAVGIDAPDQISLLETTLPNPPAGSRKNEQAGLWFGNDQDNFIKFVVISTKNGTKIHTLMEVNGVASTTPSSGKSYSPVMDLTGKNVTLNLRADPSDRSVTASYAIDRGASTTLGKWVAPPEFFSFDAAGIDPTIGTRSFGGIFATAVNRLSTDPPLTYRFDGFSLKAEGTQEPPPTGGIGFNRTSFPVTNPTSMDWGPDGRLYVSSMFGRIRAITLNQDNQVVNEQVIDTLGQRLTLGLTVDPQSTASNVILWVSHSNPDTSNGELNSSTVTRLSGSGFTTREDVITGLPRAVANHAVNSIHFGPDGKIYIAQAGNTGTGAPNTANTEFGTRAEQPLSAALLVADVRAAGFDGSCATPENTYGPSPCDVQVYSSGLRNMYDFVFHSNGSIYGPDNGLGVTGTVPPSPTPPCDGFGDPALHDPGEQPDILVRLEQGKYYGHPNPYRNECVLKDGTFQGVPPLPNYVPPIHVLGNHRSANGTIEYTGDAFNGELKGDLLIANYSAGDNITRVELSADGRSVVKAESLVGGFSDPLPLVEGPDGTIYVGEFGASKVTALTPGAASSWTAKKQMPAPVLDPEGTALGDKLYSVGGKTQDSAGNTIHLTKMDIYDPATDSWTSGPPLPGVGVEDPAVTTYNGKLYVFGGSTAPFSGAVKNAAVYNPATSSWQTLAPMPTARGGATAQAIGDKIYVAGGLSGGASVSTVEVYNPVTNTWSTAAPMATRRDNLGSAVFGGKLYVFGGRTRDAGGIVIDGTLKTVEMYDPATNRWTAMAPMPTGRRSMAVGTLNGRAQVMGGESAGGRDTFYQNEEYDPATNSWVTLEPMPSPRHGAAAGTIQGSVYVAGGGTEAGTSFSAINEAFTP